MRSFDSHTKRSLWTPHPERQTLRFASVSICRGNVVHVSKCCSCLPLRAISFQRIEPMLDARNFVISILKLVSSQGLLQVALSGVAAYDH